ncbi:TonB-dependent receptor plug domain-containing protein [Qipengyuania vesicularis]|uniref:TonB-dependent receptor plug domain-containing protein n=1 Tax=Qipengyuania vesicularis TaxID=2867232 RepID=UPI001C86B740|nr:TonB-dependent receptor [Qipengyuania vesicularis]MBX7526029.1 TonB-dependent receptor [Qipengyuania vesicularis]
MNFRRTSLLCGSALALAAMVGATPLAAQQANEGEEADDTVASDAAEEDEDDLIIVTGSQIRGARIDDVLPVTRVDEEQIEAINPGSGDELFRAIPQAGFVAFNEQNTTGGINGVRGDVASINLRALGTGNTLLLLNGRRMVNDPGFQTELLVPVVSPDTNTISPGSVRRVEVLRDGASAIYGADAVAGVVNTVLKGGLDGGFLQANYRLSDGIGLYNFSLRGGIGFDFNDGRTNFTVYGNYFHENGAPASDRFYSRSSDRRFDPRLVGTPYEQDTNFRNTSTFTPWGQFDIQGSGARTATDIGDDDFQIQPDSFSGCRLDLGNGICADNGTSVDVALRYDLDADRDLYSEKDRYNFSTLLTHEFGAGLELYWEGSYYRSESNRQSQGSALLSAVPIGISRDAYWNPFGAEFFPDGSPNPNRLQSGIDGVGPDGRDVILERYRVLDAGLRQIEVTKDVYRAVLGLRGEFGAWDFDTGFLYSHANKTDLTRNRISNTAFQDAINRSTPDAYNPFNGGCYFPDREVAPANGDCTPNAESILDGIRIDVFRKGETTLALWDFKVSRDDLFTLPGGPVGIATGIEFRRETFEDDRDPRLDGTITFTDSVTGDFFGSDVMNSSPSPDTSGDRNVYSGFAEVFVPLVSDDMDIPLIQNLSIQLAGRFERFDDIKETAIVPRVAASWSLFDSLMVRGAWSQGFRAPNLVQVNDLGTTRVNTRDDYVRCYAEILQGDIDTFDDCTGTGTVSLRTGTNVLKPEDTESINVGVVVTPTFLPGLTLTADYWRVEQKGIVGVFGDDNALALDLLRRLQGSTNPNVIRDTPDQDRIDLFAGTGLDPAGDVIQVLDPYRNLDSRIVKGWDFGMDYQIPDFGAGDFSLQFNAALLDSFFQSPGPDGQELLDAVADGTLPESIVIDNIGEQREQNGRPKWRWTGGVNWRSGPVRVTWFGRYVGGVYDSSVTQNATDINGNANPDPGALYRVDDWFTMNAAISYTIENGTAIDGTRLRFGVNNITGEAPPLADQSYGFFSGLHNARGRQFTFEIRKNF